MKKNKIDTPEAYMHDRSFSFLDTGTLIKKRSGGVILVLPDSLLFIVKLYSHASVSIVFVSLSAELSVS